MGNKGKFLLRHILSVLKELPDSKKMNFNKVLRKNLVNIPGWQTNKKIIVIESDDWGSIRMPSRGVYELLLSKNIPVDRNYFTKNDCLESEEDLTALFEVLSSFKDLNGNYPVITANSIVANPDFNRIKSSGKKKYFYEPITETYNKYPNHSRSLALWKNEGISNRLLWPQFHGREHLNVKKWMKAINSSDKWELESFEHDVLLGVGSENRNDRTFSYMAAFEYSNPVEWDSLNVIAHEGLLLFREIFGFSSKSFVAPCSIRGDHLDEILMNGGVIYHQCGQQFIPEQSGSLKKKERFWGSRNNLGQTYWRRNATFEPSRNPDFDWVDSCMAEMKIAFSWSKPAVINSHRVNYIGSIFPENRDNSLKLLKRLIQTILRKWPDIEFMTSDELGNTITRRDNKHR
jgi:hypothetical protein